MPWNPDDAKRFKKDISPASSQRWANIANALLKETGDESQAIRMANGMTRSSLQRRLERKRGQHG